MSAIPATNGRAARNPAGSAWFSHLFWLLPPLLAAWYYGGTTLNHDSAWLLHASGRWLDGARLYVDIIEVNPPLIVWAGAPVVAVARALGVPDLAVYSWLVALLAAVSLGLLSRVPTLRLADGINRHGLLLLSATALLLSPIPDYGQREHLLLILALPWLFLVEARIRGLRCGPGLAIAIGLFAAPGFALKPHFLLLPLALEGLRLVARRDPRRILRPETLACGLALGAYAVAVAVLTPEYFSVILPLAAGVYDAYTNSLVTVLVRREILMVVLVVCLWPAFRRAAAPGRLIDVLAVAILALFAAYLLQMKGWSYQRLPVLALATLFFGSGLLGVVRIPAGDREGGLRRGLVAALSAALLVWAAGGSLLHGPYRNTLFEQARPLVARQGGPLMVLGSNVWSAFPLVNDTGVGWSSRYPTLWLLPGIIRRRAAGDRSGDIAALEAGLRDAVVADLRALPPAVVLVDMREEKSHFGGIGFDYLDWFLSDPRFAAIWRGYEPAGAIGPFDVWRRRCLPDCPAAGATPPA